MTDTSLTSYDVAALDATVVALPTAPVAWAQRLEQQINAQARSLQTFDDYYSGKHPLAFAMPKFRDAFGTTFREFADNWCELVVDAVEERLNVEGFRLGDQPEGDKRAWQIWQENQLDADSQVAHTEALIYGRAYVLVWYDDSGETSARITIEHPCEFTIAYAAGDRRKRLAAFKRWLDDSGYVFGTLYLPDGIYKFRSAQRVSQSRIPTNGKTRWVAREVAGEQWPLPNPYGVVTAVELANRPRLLKPGVSEIARVVPIQNAVNKLVMDMIVASEFGAAPQRYATGISLRKDPITGQAEEPFKAMLERLWTSPSKDTQFGAFPTTQLENFVKGIEMLVQHIASQTRTPPHYFYLSGQMPSGESIKSAETGLVAKTKRKMRHFGEAWEEVIRLALLVAGDKRSSKVKTTETIWGDPESRSEAQHIDAVIKTKLLNVPDETLWEKAGFTPVEIARMKQLRALEPPPEVQETGTIRA